MGATATELWREKRKEIRLSELKLKICLLDMYFWCKIHTDIHKCYSDPFGSEKYCELNISYYFMSRLYLVHGGVTDEISTRDFVLVKISTLDESEDDS